MPKNFSAILHPNSPRYDHWHRVFGGYHVPLKSAEKKTVPAWKPEFEGQKVDVYFLDVDALPLWVKARVIHGAAEELGLPIFKVNAVFGRLGFPILASDVMVSEEARAWA